VKAIKAMEAMEATSQWKAGDAKSEKPSFLDRLNLGKIFGYYGAFTGAASSLGALVGMVSGYYGTGLVSDALNLATSQVSSLGSYGPIRSAMESNGNIGFVAGALIGAGAMAGAFVYNHYHKDESPVAPADIKSKLSARRSSTNDVAPSAPKMI
jgi:hypothetical protein